MIIAAIVNQKGGVGKTTTVQNLGAALARRGQRVLLIDLDAQGNLSDGCGLSIAELSSTVFEVMSGTVPIEEAIVTIPLGAGGNSASLDILPANQRLQAADLTFAARIGREMILRKVLRNIEGKYDVVLLDCPPSLGISTVNAMTAASGLIIPVQAHYYSMVGLTQLVDAREMICEQMNPALEIYGILMTMYDARTNLSKDVVNAIREDWKGRVYDTVIRINTKVAEAPSNAKDIFAYEPACPGAVDYAAFADEFLAKIHAKEA